jgi:N-acetylglucosamine kinase-like BadF-type ATPase
MLLPVLMNAIDVTLPDDIPPWAGRAEKAEIAALAPIVIRLAQAGDSSASTIVEQSTHDLVAHIVALYHHFQTWRNEPIVVFHGGVLDSPYFSGRVAEELSARIGRVKVGAPKADALAGALDCAIRWEETKREPSDFQTLGNPSGV